MRADPFILIFLVGSCTAELFDLEDSVPWLRTRGSDVTFSRGWDAFVVADSTCVRVNARSVSAKPSHWNPRPLSGAWVTQVCVPSAVASLCSTAYSQALPERETGVAPLYDPSFAWGGLECTRPFDGRVLHPGYGYDVTACDAIDGGGDLLYCGRSLSFSRQSVGDAVYWILCVIAVLIVRSLSYLVVGTVSAVPDAAKNSWKDVYTVVACVTALLLVWIPQGDSGFVTEEEAFFFQAVTFYCALYIALYVAYFFVDSEKKDPPIYNLIAATLQIIACRFYLSAETPYNPVLIWAVATRMLVKLRSSRWAEWTLVLSALCDSYVLSLMTVLSFSYHPYYLVAVFTLSVATSDALALT